MKYPKQYAEELQSKFDKDVCEAILNGHAQFFKQLWLMPRGSKHPTTGKRQRICSFEESRIMMYITAVKSYLV